MNYYNGFYIEEPVGNNMFSYEQRSQKSIYVPALLGRSLEDLQISDEICFCECIEGEEICCSGLEKFIELKRARNTAYIFDNHNHALYFWIDALEKGLFEKGTKLVHIDQHKDMRDPEYYIESLDKKDIFEYTNYVLNVGNFIKPALEKGIFSEVIIIDSEYGFNEKTNGIGEDFVLDIDVDIFSKDMDYIDFDLRMDCIKELAQKAKAITIATSPYFIEQEYAIELVKEMMAE